MFVPFGLNSEYNINNAFSSSKGYTPYGASSTYSISEYDVDVDNHQNFFHLLKINIFFIITVRQCINVLSLSVMSNGWAPG